MWCGLREMICLELLSLTPGRCLTEIPSQCVWRRHHGWPQEADTGPQDTPARYLYTRLYSYRRSNTSLLPTSVLSRRAKSVRRCFLNSRFDFKTVSRVSESQCSTAAEGCTDMFAERRSAAVQLQAAVPGASLASPRPALLPLGEYSP